MRKSTISKTRCAQRTCIVALRKNALSIQDSSLSSVSLNLCTSGPSLQLTSTTRHSRRQPGSTHNALVTVSGKPEPIHEELVAARRSVTNTKSSVPTARPASNRSRLFKGSSQAPTESSELVKEDTVFTRIILALFFFFSEKSISS